VDDIIYSIETYPGDWTCVGYRLRHKSGVVLLVVATPRYMVRVEQPWGAPDFTRAQQDWLAEYIMARFEAQLAVRRDEVSAAITARLNPVTSSVGSVWWHWPVGFVLLALWVLVMYATT